jgi:hypothetical protein
VSILQTCPTCQANRIEGRQTPEQPKQAVTPVLMHYAAVPRCGHARQCDPVVYEPAETAKARMISTQAYSQEGWC